MALGSLSEHTERVTQSRTPAPGDPPSPGPLLPYVQGPVLHLPAPISQGGLSWAGRGGRAVPKLTATPGPAPALNPCAKKGHDSRVSLTRKGAGHCPACGQSRPKERAESEAGGSELSLTRPFTRKPLSGRPDVPIPPQTPWLQGAAKLRGKGKGIPSSLPIKHKGHVFWQEPRRLPGQQMP